VVRVCLQVNDVEDTVATRGNVMFNRAVTWTAVSWKASFLFIQPQSVDFQIYSLCSALHQAKAGKTSIFVARCCLHLLNLVMNTAGIYYLDLFLGPLPSYT
jgi:hypothetical protein